MVYCCNEEDYCYVWTRDFKRPLYIGRLNEYTEEEKEISRFVIPKGSELVMK